LLDKNINKAELINNKMYIKKNTPSKGKDQLSAAQNMVEIKLFYSAFQHLLYSLVKEKNNIAKRTISFLKRKN